MQGGKQGIQYGNYVSHSVSALYPPRFSEFISLHFLNTPFISSPLSFLCLASNPHSLLFTWISISLRKQEQSEENFHQLPGPSTSPYQHVSMCSAFLPISMDDLFTEVSEARSISFLENLLHISLPRKIISLFVILFKLYCILKAIPDTIFSNRNCSYQLFYPQYIL